MVIIAAFLCLGFFVMILVKNTYLLVKLNVGGQKGGETVKRNVKKIISRNWKYKVYKVVKFGPVWKVHTNAGCFCFKRWKHRETQLLFVYHAIEELWHRGYYGAPRFISDIQGKKFVKDKGETYILTEWVGRPLKEDARKEWILAARELGRFHTMSKNIELPPGIGGNYFSGKWLMRFRKRIQEMREIINQFQIPSNTFEEEVARNAAIILEIAESAYETLEKSQYAFLSNNLHLFPELCHGNIKAKNFTLTEDGNVYIVDFDSLRYDLSVQDLADFFFSALSSKGWSLSFAQTLFDNYNDVRQIRPEEMPILKALLIFPYELCKLIQRYQQGRKTPEAFLKKWHKEFARFVEQQQFFERWL